MGEVYRARDSRLERDVAIKILPAHLSSSAQFRERFEREAKSISQLNHPHICTLHDVGHENGTSYLVMELLEGESLADRVAKGPLPMEQVLRYGGQIADALHRAHRHGIVHRDLKPGNIMITKSGAKLLDFGLAKTAASTPLAAFSGATEHKPLTAEGTILGTYQYMAPEQLEGLDSDPRTDIFALGTVLYEMATGRRAFDGKTKTSLIAAIVSQEPPPISQIQPITPPAFEHVVRKCLSKDPDDRWQSAHDIAEELRWIGEAGSQAGAAAPVTARRRGRARFLWVAALLLLPIAILAGMMMRTRPAPQLSYRFTVPSIGPGYRGAIAGAVSPDGRDLAFVATNDAGKQQLFIRPLDSFEAKPLPGTEGAAVAAWSPDGKFLAFVAQAKLWRVARTGGTAQLIGESGGRGVAYGHGVIVLGTMSGGLKKVTLATGAAEVITKPDPSKGEVGHILPSFLPDFEHVVFTTFGRHPRGAVHHSGYVVSLKSGKVKGIGDFPSALDVGGGYLFYVRDGVAQARRFDLATLEMSGEPITVAENVRAHAVIGTTALNAAHDGTLVWRAREFPHLLVVTDEGGRRLSTIGGQAAYSHVRVTSGDAQVVVSKIDPRVGTEDVELYGLTRPTQMRLTFDPTVEFYPILSPDGSRLYYASDKAGIPDIYARSVDGTEPERLLVGGEGEQQPCDLSPDGSRLLYADIAPGRKADLFVLPLDGGKPYPVVATPGVDRCGRFSPDGQSVAYHSDVSGRNEVYVKSLMGSSGVQQISTGGGAAARWSRDGNTLYFGDAIDRTILAAARVGASFAEPQPLFTHDRKIDSYDVFGTPSRFVLMERDDTAASPPLHVVVRWAESVEGP